MSTEEQDTTAPGGAAYVEVWQDTVSIRDLVISMAVIVGLTMGGYLLAPGEDPQPLVAGLVGALVGFIGCAVAFKPKRDVDVSDVYGASDT